MNTNKAILLVFTVTALAATGGAAAPIVIGPTPSLIPSNQYDPGADGSAADVDLVFTQTLAAGTYTATGFDLFVEAAGSAEPFLAVVAPGATGNGSSTDSFKVIALGNASAFASGVVGTTAHVAFGGSDTFTLTSSTVVYAGFNSTAVSGVVKSLYSYLNPSPVLSDLDTAKSLSIGGSTGTFSYPGYARNYLFDVDLVVAAPEPASLVLSGLGALGLFWVARRSRRS